MLRRASYFHGSVLLGALAIAPPHPMRAQLPPPDTVHAIAALHSTVLRAGPAIGPRIWPGFRPDTIPTLYVIPHRAKLLAQWRDTLPTGFLALPGVADAAWTDTRPVSFPRGRAIAFLSVDSSASPASVVGLALHEAFHAFYRATARNGRRFGAGENSMLVATYPAFDVANEAAFALEGKLLAGALRARSTADAARFAREFLFLRDGRHARLDATVTEFETAAELNEGLAQYAQLRGLRELAREDRRRFARAADVEAAYEIAVLDSLLAVGPRSVRRRFYATGSAMALLLDRLADPSWKERLVRDDATLQDMLAGATGYRGRESLDGRTLRRLESELSMLRREAERTAATLAARRAAQRDSILARPGLRLVIDPSRLPRRRLDWCSFDPQNVLQTAAGELLHMRMLRVCSGAAVEAQFAQPAVEDRETGMLRAAVGEAEAMKVTTNGKIVSLPADGETIDVPSIRLESQTFSLVAARATLTRRGEELWVTPVPGR